MKLHSIRQINNTSYFSVVKLALLLSMKSLEARSGQACQFDEGAITRVGKVLRISNGLIGLSICGM